VTPLPGALPLEKPGGEDEKAMFFRGFRVACVFRIVSQCDAFRGGI
jgi:hypothetical protein